MCCEKCEDCKGDCGDTPAKPRPALVQVKMPGAQAALPRIWALVATQGCARVYCKQHGKLVPRHDYTVTAADCADGNTAAFALHIALMLEKAAQRAAFDRLVIIAAPALRAALQKAASPAVSSRIVAEASPATATADMMPDDALLARQAEEMLWF